MILIMNDTAGGATELFLIMFLNCRGQHFFILFMLCCGS